MGRPLGTEAATLLMNVEDFDYMMSMNVEKNFLSFPCLLMKGKEFQRFHCFLEFTIGTRVIFQVPGGTL